MGTYKLTYFSAKGTAEVSRFIFAQAGVKYEDVRLTAQEWPAEKSKFRTGMLPELELDGGKRLSGSKVISRFLAERFGLAGSNEVENAEIAGIQDTLSDFMTNLYKCFMEKDEGKKAAMMEKVKTEDVPKYWGVIEGMCRKNDCAEGWIYGKKMTYVDLDIYCGLEYLLSVLPALEESYPCVAKLRAAVAALPKIKQWIDTRPTSEW